MRLYKYKITQNASSTDSPNSNSSSITLKKSEVFRNIMQCKLWIGITRRFVEEDLNTKFKTKQSNLNKPEGSFSMADPSSRPPQLATEDNDEDDEEQAKSVLFASDFQYGITTLPTLNDNDNISHPEKPVLKHSGMEEEEEEEVDLEIEPNDLKPPTLGFNEASKNLLQNEDLHVPENGTLIMIVEQDSARSNPKKNLFHPLLIFPILLSSLGFSCILGTAYNKYLGRSEDRSKVLKVPRMAIFSDAPLNSIAFPPVTEAEVHAIKKQGIEVV